MPFAEIAVDSPAPQKTYTFSIPEGVSLAPGQAVWVPFGRGSQLTQGIVFNLTEREPEFPLKPIAALLEAQPLLSRATLGLAHWLSDYYLTPLFDCAALFMPPGFRQRVRTAVALAPPRPGAAGVLTDRQRQLLEYVGLNQAPRDTAELAERFGRRIEAQVRSLVNSGHLLQISQFERPRTGPKFVRRIAPTALGLAADVATPQWSRRFRQRAVLEALRLTPEGVDHRDLRSRAGGTTAAALQSLEREGFVRTWEERVVRDPLAHRSFQEGFAPPLTVGQTEAVRQITAALADASPAKSPFLLYGVTGSGKTEVYLQALKECVARGKRGIVLVPEIALEPQTVARFSARFPGRVAVLHSGLTPGEAYDEWWRIRGGEFDVVVGPRSALFAPQPDLGLIVIDEEHEPTYKQQDPPPRYHARAVAVRMARATGSVLVLGSATPDVGSYVQALQHRLRLVELPDRPTNRSGTAGAGDRRGLPSVVVTDLREELRAGNRSIFSRPLQTALVDTLRRRQQAILFLNRRGAATFIQCRDCGMVVRCRRCESTMTYHSAQERLQCHQCNYRVGPPKQCRQCGSVRIRFLGVGTQKVASEVVRFLPGVRVLRWDRDTTAARGAHQALLAQFAGHEADVLVGTQMVAKGHDFPQGTLVGVVSADTALNLPDFRAGERTFDLLTQVAGRAGRGEQPGRVVIQTYCPNHYAIQAAGQHDYRRFYEEEIRMRRSLALPPFAHLIELTVLGGSLPRVNESAQALAVALRRACPERSRGAARRHRITLLGPAPHRIPRLRRTHRVCLMLKGREVAPIVAVLRTVLGPGRKFHGLPVLVDVDPV